MEISPYLTFQGTCAEAMSFYAGVFGGSIEVMVPYAGSPLAGELSTEAQDGILHARVRIGDRLIMASDHFSGTFEPVRGMSVQVAFDDLDKASRAFARLSHNGETHMAFSETYWAKGFGSCTDRYGIPWIVNCDKPDAPLP